VDHSGAQRKKQKKKIQGLKGNKAERGGGKSENVIRAKTLEKRVNICYAKSGRGNLEGARRQGTLASHETSPEKGHLLIQVNTKKRKTKMADYYQDRKTLLEKGVKDQDWK